MNVSTMPYQRAVWPFGKGALAVWKKPAGPRRNRMERAVRIPIETESPRHEPVMAAEILEDFRLEPGDTVFDGTLGLGGHSLRLLEKIAPGGTLVGTDWDEAMLAEARSRLAARAQELRGAEVGLRLIHSDFRALPDYAKREGLQAKGILLDLGLNSAQIEDAARGFAFQSEGPLDMRMDRSAGEPASAVLQRMTPAQIEAMLRDLGDERWARAIARQIVERRKQKPLRTTQDLVDCVLAAIPPGAREKRIHPATRTFQAVRIFVNAELEGLAEALSELAECLQAGGTLCVLSYHSGEDRIVKRAFRGLADQGFEELRRKPLGPTEAEIRRNPRARSAKLRSLRRAAPTERA
jgi:16S rRNA (cytosine1402-N4)-methyltransferase